MSEFPVGSDLVEVSVAGGTINVWCLLCHEKILERPDTEGFYLNQIVSAWSGHRAQYTEKIVREAMETQGVTEE